jgi:hypothetical protein
MLQNLIRLCVVAFCVGFAVTACTQGSGGPTSAPAAVMPPTFGLYFTDEGRSAKLAYGEPNSDNVGLMMECAKGSRQVKLTDVVRSTSAPSLILVSEGRRSELKAAVEPGAGHSIYTANAPAAAPALAGFRRSGKIEVGYAGLRYGIAAKPNERPGVERFFAACDGGKT